MKIKTTLYIQAIKFFFEDDFKIIASTIKSETDGSHIVIDIDETEVELETLDLTQDDFKNGHIEQLRELKKSVKAETQLKLNSLDEQINSLLALECKDGAQ